MRTTSKKSHSLPLRPSRDDVHIIASALSNVDRRAKGPGAVPWIVPVSAPFFTMGGAPSKRGHADILPNQTGDSESPAGSPRVGTRFVRAIVRAEPFCRFNHFVGRRLRSRSGMMTYITSSWIALETSEVGTRADNGISKYYCSFGAESGITAVPEPSIRPNLFLPPTREYPYPP